MPRLKYLIYFIKFFFFTIAAHAQNPKISVDNFQNKLILSSENCDVLMEEVNNIMLWSFSSLLGKKNVKRPQFNSVKNQCYVVIDEIVPDFLKRLHNVEVPTDGPNCYSSIFIDLGIIKNPRHVSSVELRHWIESNLCSPLKPDEKPMPGDVAIVRNNASFFEPGFSIDSHGMIFVTELLVLTKDSMAKETRYALEPFNQSTHVRNLDPRCINKFGLNAPEYCENYLSFFRCNRQLIGDLVSWPGLDKEYNDMRRVIEKMEAQLMMNSHDNREINLEQISKQITDVNNNVKDKIKNISLKSNLSSSEKLQLWLYESLRISISSLDSQLYWQINGLPK